MYALPWELYKDRGIRRYGAHGTSYQYLVGRAAQILQRPASELNLIIAHVGDLAAAICSCLMFAPSQSWAFSPSKRVIAQQPIAADCHQA